MSRRPAGLSRREPNVAVIVLNWNGSKVTSQCLASVVGLDYPTYTIVVVDNGSVDGSPADLRSEFPDVELIALERNVGLSEGYNAGLSWALDRGHDYALLLNNDVILCPDVLHLLVEAAECRPDVGLVSPKIYLGQPPSDRIYWTGGWLTLKPWGAPTRGYRQHERGRFEDIQEADLAANTAVLARCQMVREVGLLDPVYFYMCEDFDWSMRARLQGYRVLYEPRARVWHLESSTIGFLSRRMVYYYVRNMWLLVDRYHPGWRAMRATLTAQGCLLMLMFVLTGRPDAVRVPIWAWLDYKHRRFGEATFRFPSDLPGLRRTVE